MATVYTREAAIARACERRDQERIPYGVYQNKRNTADFIVKSLAFPPGLAEWDCILEALPYCE